MFNQNNFGLVVNLYQKVQVKSRLASIILGDFAIGSILDPMGNSSLNSARIDVQYRWLVESPAPGIIDRQSLLNHCKLVLYL